MNKMNKIKELNSNNYYYFLGYILHWREQGLEWAEVQLPSEKSNHKFSGLNCGSVYQFYITAFNSMGKGQPSDVILAKTEGSGK